MKKLYKRIVTMGMIGLSSILAWIYCMYEYRDKPVYIAVASVIVVGAMFIFLNSILDLHLSKQDDMKKFLSNTVNDSLSKLSVSNDESERVAKASYVQIRKQNQLLQDISSFEKDGFAAMADINAQAVDSINNTIVNTINKSTKVIVKYNSTNTDKVIEAFEPFREDIDRLISHVDSFLAAFSQFTSDYAATNEQEKEHNVEIKNNIIDSIEKFKQELKYFSNQLLTNGIPSGTKVPTVTEVTAEEPTIEDTVDEEIHETVDSTDGLLTADMLSDLFGDDKKVEPVVEEPIVEEPIVEETKVEETAAEETAPDLGSFFDEFVDKDFDDGADMADVIPFPRQEEDSKETTFDPNRQLTPDEIATLFAASSQTEENNEKAVASTDPIPMTSTEPKNEEVVAVTPVSDDPNKQLSPEEIAALFAAAAPSEEPKVEETKVEEPEAVAVAPVSDDPNKKLSPEEIAALFASAGI